MTNSLTAIMLFVPRARHTGGSSSVQHADSPISIASLRKFCDDAAKIAAKANTDIVRLDEMRRKEQPLVATMKRLQLVSARRTTGE
jgi:hypothetical protein